MIRVDVAKAYVSVAQSGFEEKFADYLQELENEIIKAAKQGCVNVSFSLKKLSNGERECLFRYLNSKGFTVRYPITHGQAGCGRPSDYCYNQTIEGYYLVEWEH